MIAVMSFLVIIVFIGVGCCSGGFSGCGGGGDGVHDGSNLKCEVDIG